MAVQNNSTFVIADRTIILPLNIDTFGVVGDSNSKIVEFRTNRYVDGIDLSTKQIYVCYKNASTETGETECVDIKFTSTTLTFNWIVPAETTTTKGNIEFYVEFRTKDSEGNTTYRLKTKPISQYVEDAFYIYNNVIEPDTSIIDSWLQSNSQRIDRTDLIDADLPFKVDDRTIVFNPDKVIAVENDNLSQALTFRLKRFVDGIDRANATFAFAFRNPQGKSGLMQACNIMHTEDEVFISWALENLVTQISGKVDFFIIALNTLADGKRYCWNTKPTSFIVETTLKIENDLEIPSEKWYETLMLEVDNAVKQASIYANDAKEYYNKTSTVSTIADSTLESCKEAELNAQKYAIEAKEAFSSLKDISITRENKLENGIFETVSYTRKDKTLYCKTTLIFDESIQKHTGLFVQFYASDGSTITSEKTYPIAYDDEGCMTGYFTILNFLSYHVDMFSKTSDGIKTGTVITHMGLNAPKGYLICDGSEYSIADYVALANYFKSEFGSINHFGGDGVATFAVPAITETIIDMIRCIKY